MRGDVRHLAQCAALVQYALVSAIACALVACGHPDDVRKADQRLDADLKRARDRGAYDCAPVQLARGEANLVFARYELGQGDISRARKHVAIADVDAARALDLTELEICRSTIVPNDRDGDRIADDVDQCPDEAEDFDGFQDEDGCPDRDNDQDGISDVNDKCPNEPGDERHHGCPIKDRDGDGIPDDVDQCPDIPEDFDGVSDEDGCPENERRKDTPASRDRDGDGVVDAADQCPDLAGLTPSGCPKRVLVEKTDTQIRIKQAIVFDAGKSSMTPGVSDEILDQVADIMRAYPGIAIAVEGHSDNAGDPKTNLKLTEDRANVVRTALIGRGINPNRLTSQGWGHAKPITTNKTSSGRALNRRIEFNIIGSN